jgi:predicted alpha/beta superfamily hydrolase
MKPGRTLLLSILALAMGATSTSLAAHVATPIVIGESHRIESRAMGDERAINVYLPEGYADAAKRFPVLYLIDGGLEQDFLHIAGTSQLGSIWARSQAVIVVGIETKDRRRELIGPTQDVKLLADYPTAGFSAGFRNYIRDEVKPLIERTYRTSGDDAVIGESLAGLFIVETFLREPTLFDGYAAISPSLWWDQQRLSREAEVALAHRRVADTRLYLTLGNEGAEMQSAADRLATALAAHPGNAGQWCYVPRPQSTHATIYHDVSPTALQYLFPTPVDQDPESGFVIACSKKS